MTESPIPRYGRHPLPERAFVPGRTPRPDRPVWPHPIPAWEPEDWATLEPWLHAIDLFNHGFWWEAHEALEGLWHAAGRSGPAAGLVQALIHVSAAYLNRRRGHAAAARRQADRGIRGLSAAAAAGVRMGFDPRGFARDVRRSFHEEDAAGAILILDRSPAD